MKDNIQSADWRVLKLRFCCGGFIQETDFAKANPVIEEFRLSI
jgi:hypothetical protein